MVCVVNGGGAPRCVRSALQWMQGECGAGCFPYRLRGLVFCNRGMVVEGRECGGTAPRPPFFRTAR